MRLVLALERVVDKIQSRGDLPQLLRLVIDEARHLLGAEASALFLYDEVRADLWFEAVSGGDDALRGLRVPLGQGIVGHAARHREIVAVPDVDRDPRHHAVSSSFPVRDLLAVPMVRQDRLIGVIEVLNSQLGGFDAMDQRVLGILAQQAAVQIENTRLFEEKLRAERLAALDTSSAGVAHRLRNILGRWEGNAQLVQHGLDQGDTELAGEAWAALRGTHARIAQLVRDMLSYTRSRPYVREHVDLGEVARRALQTTAEYAAEAQVPQVLEVEPSCELWTDPDCLQEVLVELLTNAISSLETQQGPRPPVVVRARARDGRALVEVVDQGPGIPSAHLDRVFEPYFTTRGSQGTGLGLALVSKAIQELGGRVHLDSTPGQGTVVRIDLPLDRSQA